MIKKRYFVLSYLSLCFYFEINSAIYITEVSNNFENSFVELYNSSDSIKSIKNWSVEYGLNKQKLDGELCPNSVIILNFEMTVGFGDSLLLKNEKAQLLDKIVFSESKTKGVTGELTYQRDTVVLSQDGKVHIKNSPFKQKAESEGSVSLFEEDRTIIIYSFDDDDNELVGSFQTREINKNGSKVKKKSELYDLSSSVSVFPNPVGTILNIRSDKKGKVCYRIESLQGYVFHSGFIENGLAQVDMIKCVPSVYLLIVGEGDERQVIKLEKK